MSGSKIIYLDQVIGPLSIDIINHFKAKNNIEVMYGGILSTSEDLHEGVNKIKLKSYNRSSTIKRIESWISFFCQSNIKLLFKGRAYKLFVVSNPPLNIFTAYFMHLIFGIEYYLLVFDVYPDTLVKYGYLNSNSILTKIWNKMNYKSFKNAQKIFTLTPAMQQLIENQGGKAEIVPIWANTTSIKPVKSSENVFIKMNGLQGRFVILYSGNFGQTHNIESILDAAENLKENVNIKFVFIGDGYKRQLIEDRINKSGLHNIILLPFQDKSIFPHSITSGNISIVTLDKRASEVSIPSKLFYYMAAGNTIISLADNNSELARLVEKYNIGVNLDDTKLNTLSIEILKLYENKEQCDLFSHNSRKASINHTQKNVNLFTLG